MSHPEKTNRRVSSVRQPVLLGLFTGTAVGAGYLLAAVPNIELMTLIVALCGGVLGSRAGCVCGALSAVIYSLGSPFGLPVPVMLAAQAVGLGAAGVLGGALGNRVLAEHYKRRRRAVWLWSVAIGLGSTLIYDCLTNLAIIAAFETPAAVVLAGAIPFALIHLGSNAVVFGALVPLLLPRLAGLSKAALVGKTGALVIAAVMLVGGPDRVRAQAVAESPATEVATPTAETDSTTGLATPLPPTGPAAAFGWQRPLWEPFARTGLEWLKWRSNLVPIIDGGLGASAMILGEAGTDPHPVVVRDGIPVGTGHALVDDPWLIPTTALIATDRTPGPDGRGGTGGVWSLRSEDATPDRAASAYRGVKGKHETYFRSIHLLTPRAAWRAAFEFEESLDKEGYNFTADQQDVFAAGSNHEFPGHSRVRQSRARLFRELDPDNRLIVEYGNGRLTKDSLPALGAEHLELWDDSIAATMQARRGRWRIDTNLFWRNRDLIWGDRADNAVVGENSRKLETAREGVNLTIDRAGEPDSPGLGLVLQATNWRVYDSLTSESWLAGFTGTGTGDGQTVHALVRGDRQLGPLVWEVRAGGNWHSLAGAGPEAGLRGAVRGAKPWWEMRLDYGGRAPRSDELLTPLRRDVAGRQLILLPNSELQREKTLRAGMLVRLRVLGLDLAADGSMTRLTDGISWQALPGDPERGIWRNNLELDSTRLTATVAHEGRFLGWGRMLLEGTWQESTERAGRASFLPPKRYLRSQLSWENHFFQEDGILQLALFSTWQGAMADPWDVTRSAQLPSRTVHDLLVGFRLVGAHLSLAFRNLTGERTRLTSGALSTGQEMDLRLYWAWVY